MKTLQVPFNYYPEPIGGTEIYASALSQRLREQGVDVAIAAVGESAEYVHEGIKVYRFGLTPKPADPAMLYGDGDPVATREFAEILDRAAPDLVHLHAMSPAVSVKVVREISKRGIPTVFTCHIPGVVCPRATLLRYGTQVCDGVWGLHKCSSCSLQNIGLPIPLANLMSRVPSIVNRCIGSLGVRGPAMTVLRMTELQARRRNALVHFLQEVDRIVAVSCWMREMLVANGVPSDKIVLCRHGSTQEVSARMTPPQVRDDGELRVAFLGRLDPTKGAQILIAAIRRHPELRLKLDIYGIIQDAPAYAQELCRLADGDSRIEFHRPVPNNEVVNRLRGYDVLAVPSQWMETGPLVVYDAFSAGIPVLGSNRGGIAELVEHGQNGLLVEASDVGAWADAFSRLSKDQDLLPRLRLGVRPGRAMKAVAFEMAELYQSLMPMQVLSQ